MSHYYLRKYREKTAISIGYARVSSLDNRQELGLEVQKEALKACDILLLEKESGAHDERQYLKKALELAKLFRKAGKSVTLVIYKLDRLTRKMFTLVEILNELNQHQISLVSLKEKIETDSLTGRLLCVILGYVAEMELTHISERTKDGLRKAKERGAKLGNQGLSKEKEQEIINLYLHSEFSTKKIAKEANVSVASIYNVLKRNNIPKKSKKKQK